MPPVKQTCKLPNGEIVEMFYIGSLASALGRDPNTVRRWEIGDIIPDSCFRDKFGRRLYTQEQIDVIVKCAERAKVKQGASIANTSFSLWCHRELAKLQETYKGG